MLPDEVPEFSVEGGVGWGALVVTGSGLKARVVDGGAGGTDVGCCRWVEETLVNTGLASEELSVERDTEIEVKEGLDIEVDVEDSTVELEAERTEGTKVLVTAGVEATTERVDDELGSF